MNASISAPRNRAMEWAVFLLGIVQRWPGEALRAAAWWALAVLVVEQVSPQAVIADPAARLRWVLASGAVTAALGLIPFHGPPRAPGARQSPGAA